MKLDDISVCMAGDHLEVSGDPQVLRDVCTLLQQFTDLTRYLQKRLEHVNAVQAAKLEVDKARHEIEYAKETVKIYGVFLRHLNNGCGGDKKLALQETRRELKLMACDARLFVAQGRRLEREQRRTV
jgi:hypothetical protein